MREALAEALQDYDGALVVVAHDRHLLRATTDALWLVADGRVAPFDGDLDDYRDWVLAATRTARGSARPHDPAPPVASRSGTDGRRTRVRQAQKRAEAEARQARHAAQEAARRPASRSSTREIAALAREKADADAWLAGADAYADANRDRLKETIARQGDVGSRLARLEAEWLELAEAIERIDAGET